MSEKLSHCLSVFEDDVQVYGDASTTTFFDEIYHYIDSDLDSHTNGKDDVPDMDSGMHFVPSYRYRSLCCNFLYNPMEII